MQNLYEGIILKYVDYKDNDKILTIFTKNGLQSLIAKGVKTGKRANLLDTGNLISYDIVKTKGLPILTTVILKNSFAEDKPQYSFYILFLLEVILKIQREGEDESLMYSILLYCLQNLSGNSNLYLSLFLVKVLYYEGVFIDLYSCLVCGKEFNENSNIIVSSEGVTHLSCSNLKEKNINNDTIKLLRYLLNFDIRKNKFNFSIDDLIIKESLFYLISFTENFFSSSIKSKEYITV